MFVSCAMYMYVRVWDSFSVFKINWHVIMRVIVILL